MCVFGDMQRTQEDLYTTELHSLKMKGEKGERINVTFWERQFYQFFIKNEIVA